MVTRWFEIRKGARRSRAWCAATAGVSEPTAKLFELDPDAVQDPDKREALRRVYLQLEAAKPGLAKTG